MFLNNFFLLLFCHKVDISKVKYGKIYSNNEGNNFFFENFYSVFLISFTNEIKYSVILRMYFKMLQYLISFFHYFII